MIYVVMGATGEYSDRTEWAVCAFTEEWKAQRFVSQIETELRKIEAAGIDFYRTGNWSLREALMDQLQKFDPNCRIIDDEPRYWVEPVELLDGVPIVEISIPRLVQDTADRENFRANCEWGKCAACGASGHLSDPRIVEVGHPGDSERWQWLCAKCREARES